LHRVGCPLGPRFAQFLEFDPLAVGHGIPHANADRPLRSLW
jgi:hypothetical protein